MKNISISVCSTLVALLAIDVAAETPSEKAKTQEKVISQNKRQKVKYIELKKSEFIQLKEDAKNVFINDQEIADIQMIDSKSLYLMGLKPGTTSLQVYDQKGKIILDYEIRVTYQLKDINDAIHEVYPDLDVKIASIEDSIILSGKIPSPEVAKDVRDIIRTFIPTEKIIDKMTIETSTQVMLKVKIAEVTRSVTKDLGVRWRALSYGKSLTGMHYGMVSGPANQKFLEQDSSSSESSSSSGSGGESSSSGSATTGSTADLMSKLQEEGGALSATVGGLRWIVHSGGHHGLSAILDALANETFATILAEPTLITLSGTKATFKSGGEKGYTVTQPNSDSRTTEFKEWGTSIEFTPVVIAEDRINITVTPKVSSLENTNTADNVPSITTKEATTTVELGSGQSLAIAGLLQKSTNSATIESPFLAQIPFFGAFFKSSGHSVEERELVIIITPYIVKPSSKQLKTPTDMIPKLYSPLETILSRKFHKNLHTHTINGNKKLDTGFSIK